MTTNPETRISDFIDANRESQTRFLAELVKLASDNPPGDCAAHGARAGELIEGLGLEVERHPVPAKLVAANGMISATNLVIRRRFSDGPVIALNSHGDVVPPGQGWSRDPYGAEVVDGHMYGRGVAVSKSDFATYVFALLALDSLDVPLAGSIELHLTYDEEAGGNIGPKWLLDEGISKPDYCIGAGFSYGVVTTHNGCLHLEVEIAGRSAHAALPDTGRDALEAATAVMTALYAERRSYAGQVSAVPGIGAPQLTIGLIAGGINTNVVPDQVTFRLDRRITPEEDLDAVEARLREVIAGAAGNFADISLTIRRILLSRPLTELAGSGKLSGALCRRASEVFGVAVEPRGVPLYTDARHYTAAGVPCVLYGAGPRSIEDANAHRADERLALDDLFGATKVVALTLLDLLAGPD